MLHITLTDKVPTTDPTDPLTRDFYGWSEQDSIKRNWDSNRGYWVLGARAEREPFVLFSHRGTVVMAARIDRLVDAPGKPGRKIIEGTPLDEGHPVYEEYVGRPAPERARGARNPITYLDSNVGGRPCGCGCGTEVFAGEFVRGHEQTALHQRVAQIGSITEFLRWFDRLQAGSEPAASAVRSLALTYRGHVDLTVKPDGHVMIELKPDHDGG